MLDLQNPYGRLITSPYTRTSGTTSLEQNASKGKMSSPEDTPCLLPLSLSYSTLETTRQVRLYSWTM